MEPTPHPMNPPPSEPPERRNAQGGLDPWAPDGSAPLPPQGRPDGQPQQGGPAQPPQQGGSAQPRQQGGFAQPPQQGWPAQPPPGWTPQPPQQGWPAQPPPGWTPQPPHQGGPAQPPPGWQGPPAPQWPGNPQHNSWPSQDPRHSWGTDPGAPGQPPPLGPPPPGARPPRERRKPLDPAQREEVAQTLLYTVGSAILIAGLVLLVALVFPLSTSLLIYAFAVGVTVVSLIFVLMKRSSRAGMAILVIAAGLGLAAATASWEAVEVPPLVGLVMATLLAAVAAAAARLGGSPSTLVWLAWVAATVDLFAPDAFTSALVGALCLLAMVGRGWPRHQLGVALAVMLAGFQGLSGRDQAWPFLWLVSTTVLTLWLVHFHRATPAVPGAERFRRPPWALPSRGEVGGQPWVLSWILLPTAWFVSFFIRGVPEWVPLLMAAIVLVAALALPEPPGATNPQGPMRDGLAMVGASVVGITLLVGRIDQVVEPLVLLGFAIAAQVVPVVKSPIGWLFRAILAVLALFAAADAAVAVWVGAVDLVSDPVTIVQGVLLTVLGVTLMMFRHGRVNEVLDGVRFVGGLYLCVHGVVLAASLTGSLVGNPEGGFYIGHAVASLGWMAFAAFLALRKDSAADLTLAVAVALGAATKLVLFDMATLSGIARVAAFMGCGAIMVLIAFMRQRRQPTGGPGSQGQAPPPPPSAPASWEAHVGHGQ